MMIKGPAAAEISYVCQNLRRSSYDEIFGIRDDAPEAFAEMIIGIPGHKWVGYCDGKPAAVIGAYPMHRGVWGLMGFGTDDWINIWKPVTRVARRDMMQAVLDAGAHRAQCVTLADHFDTHRWLRLLGATVETPMPKFGKDGQDYTMFAWIKDD